MSSQDKRLRCVDCGQEFVWTAGEQDFFADMHFEHEPKRCRACKTRRVTARPVLEPSGRRARVETPATCSSCGRETTVPFRPTQGRPVFCRECYQQRKHARA
jgi:CxxC-x17-CxxC domain-containing protein